MANAVEVAFLALLGAVGSPVGPDPVADLAFLVGAILGLLAVVGVEGPLADSLAVLVPAFLELLAVGVPPGARAVPDGRPVAEVLGATGHADRPVGVVLPDLADVDQLGRRDAVVRLLPRRHQFRQVDVRPLGSGVRIGLGLFLLLLLVEVLLSPVPATAGRQQQRQRQRAYDDQARCLHGTDLLELLLWRSKGLRRETFSPG